MLLCFSSVLRYDFVCCFVMFGLVHLWQFIVVLCSCYVVVSCVVTCCIDMFVLFVCCFVLVCVDKLWVHLRVVVSFCCGLFCFVLFCGWFGLFALLWNGLCRFVFE